MPAHQGWTAPVPRAALPSPCATPAAAPAPASHRATADAARRHPSPRRVRAGRWEQTRCPAALPGHLTDHAVALGAGRRSCCPAPARIAAKRRPRCSVPTHHGGGVSEEKVVDIRLGGDPGALSPRLATLAVCSDLRGGRPLPPGRRPRRNPWNLAERSDPSQLVQRGHPLTPSGDPSQLTGKLSPSPIDRSRPNPSLHPNFFSPSILHSTNLTHRF